MKLIGMLDSPYVRRTAISLQLLGVPFEHQSLSVFRTYDQFRRINPVVKAPTMVCDDGTVLMDSTLILQYAEVVAGRSLLGIAFDRLVFEPIHFVMERKMLLTLKERAEEFALNAGEKSAMEILEEVVRT